MLTEKENMKKKQLITATYPGQLFSTTILPKGTKFLKWEIASGGRDSDFTSFNIMENKSSATDPTHFSGVLSGT